VSTLALPAKSVPMRTAPAAPAAPTTTIFPKPSYGLHANVRHDGVGSATRNGDGTFHCDDCGWPIGCCTCNATFDGAFIYLC